MPTFQGGPWSFPRTPMINDYKLGATNSRNSISQLKRPNTSERPAGEACLVLLAGSDNPWLWVAQQQNWFIFQYGLQPVALGPPYSGMNSHEPSALFSNALTSWGSSAHELWQDTTRISTPAVSGGRGTKQRDQGDRGGNPWWCRQNLLTSQFFSECTEFFFFCPSSQLLNNDTKNSLIMKAQS